MKRRAVFIDKDGTLVENVPYNVDPDRIVLTPNAISGLRLLQDAGFALVLISNQSGLARGYFDEADLARHLHQLRRLLTESGVALLDACYCPHLPDAPVARYAIACDCRKPAPGLLVRAAREHDIDLAASFLIGDILDDVEAGSRAGCRTVLLDRGSETEWLHGPYRAPDYVAADLAEAARLIAGARMPESATRSGRHEG